MAITKRFDGGDDHPISNIPPMPTHCSHIDCREKVAVLLCRVRDDRGVIHTNWFSKFGRKESGGLRLNGCYTFLAWIGHCNRHYMVKSDENCKAHLPSTSRMMADREAAKNATGYLEAHADHLESQQR
jgi:hypothetical protein